MTEPRPCPVCGAPVQAAELWLEENIDPAKVSGLSFASRKPPEYMCHRMMRCTVCDVVYADNPPDQQDLAHAYHVAEYDSAEEASDAADAYMKAMGPILAKLPQKASVMEIGAGTGVLLERLAEQGFTTLVGVEPSSAAIAAAPAHRRAWLKEGIFEESDFAPASFDLICCFMTLEHVREPLATAQSARRLLKPGGAFVAVTHDYGSLVNRLLGSKSPIVDIEHMQLFSGRSICALFQAAGFQETSSRPFYNRYSLRYWLKLAPLPPGLKKMVDSICTAAGHGNIQVKLNVGNTMTAGY